MSHTRLAQSVLLLAGLGASLLACGTTTPPFVDAETTPTAQTPAYIQDVLADEPLAHWRLHGDEAGAIKGDVDRAMALSSGHPLTLRGSDFGGPEVAVELWVREARGTLLTWADAAKKPALSVTIEDTLAVELLGQRVDTRAPLKEDTWQLVGLSRRSSDGLMMVSIDGRLVWRGKIKQGEPLPFDGELVVGGDFEGGVDEVAVYDQFKYPSHWLHRALVARQHVPPSVSDSTRPVRSVIQTGCSTGVFGILAWSPDGTRLTAGGNVGEVRVLEAATGAVLFDIGNHTGAIQSLHWSPDSTRLVTASLDGTAEVWDAARGTLIHALAGHTNGILSARWSPDGTKIATAGQDGALKVWRADIGDLVLDLMGPNLGPHPVESVFWSPDGTRLASSGAPDADRAFKIWDAASGALIQALEVKKGRATSARWSPDSTRIATVDRTLSTRVWEAATGKLLHELEGEDSSRQFALWSPDGTQLATGGSGSNSYHIKIWDADTGKLRHDLRSTTSILRAMVWSPDGSQIASTDLKGVLKVWDTATGALRHELNGSKGVFWSPDGTRLASAGGDAEIQVWDVQRAARLYPVVSSVSHVASLSWSPKGSRLAAAGAGLQVWDASTGLLARHLEGHTDFVHKASWSPDGSRIASSSKDKTLKVWDADTGELIHDIQTPKSISGLVQWSPDSTRFATNSPHLRIWDAATGALRHNLKAPSFESGIKSMAWSPDGKWIATGSGDKSIKIWNAATGELRHTFLGHASWVISIAWSTESTRVASVETKGRPGTLKMWDASSGALLQTIDGVGSASWSPDGARFVTLGQKLKIWKASDVSLIHDLPPQGAGLGGITWSPDSARFASGTTSRTIGIWEVATGDRLQTLESHAQSIQEVAWSPSGTQLASTALDKTTRLWDLGRGQAVTLLSGPGGAWLSIVDEGFYAGSRLARSTLVMSQGTRAFAIDQLSPMRNRPDKILAWMGAPKAQIQFYEALWRRRLARLGLAPDQVSEDFTSAPSVRILAVGPPDKSGQVQMEVVFKDTAGLRGYRIYVNGVPLSTALVKLEGERQRLTIPVQLTRGTNQIEVSALNVQGVESLRTPTTIEHESTDLPQPRLFYLGFGVSDYLDDRLDLAFAHKDALDLAAALKNRAGEGFASVETMVLTDGQVSSDALERALGFLAQVSEHDTLVMFIAGHGVRDTDAERTYYYLDHDAKPEDLAGTAIAFEAIEALLFESRARKKLFLMDTCQSGQDIDLATLTAPLGQTRGLRARSLRGFKPTGQITLRPEEHDHRKAERWLDVLRNRDRLILQDLRRRSGAIVLASSLGQESSLEAQDWDNGAFSEEILKALETNLADANKDGFIDTDELKSHVIESVPDLTGGRQHPNVERDNPLQKFALPLGP